MIRKVLLLLLLICLVLPAAGCASGNSRPSSTPASATSPPRSSTPVAAYFYSGAVESFRHYNEAYQSTGNLFPDYAPSVLDVLYYSFAVPGRDGSVTIDDTSGLEECLALQTGGTKVILCVSGVSEDYCSAFMEITSAPDRLSRFVTSLMDCVDRYGFDGADIDWEAVSPELKPSAAGMNDLLRALRAEMDRRGASRPEPYYLSCAVPASSWGTAEDRFDFHTINTLVDYVNIMSYDLNTENTASHLSPLYTSSCDNGYGFGADYGVSRLCSLGMDPSKLMIGCAGYGKAYRLPEPDSPDARYPGLGKEALLCELGLEGSFASGTVYGGTIQALRNSGSFQEYTERTPEGRFVGSYLYDSSRQLFITFDSTEAVRAKMEYAGQVPGMGVMYWSYTDDSDSHVLQTLRDCVLSSGS